MYHGTEKKRGEKILSEQKMPVSISTDRKQHWLGDGVYFYRERFYAFRWIILMYKERNEKDNEEEELLKKYSILEADIEYNTERIFNLDNPEHCMVFKETERKLKEKGTFSEKLKNMEYTDGVVINVMFKNMKYGDNYDAVEATFPIYDFNIPSSTGSSRIKSLNEYQLCIKNSGIIKEIRDITEFINVKDFRERFIKFEKLKAYSKGQNAANGHYRNSQRSEKYGKRKNFGR